MFAFFTGETCEECVAWVSAIFDDHEFKDKQELIQAQVEAIMAAKAESRDYPELLPGSTTRAYLRDDLDYAFDITHGVIFNVNSKLILQLNSAGQVSIKGKAVRVNIEGLRVFIPRPDHPGVSSDHINGDHTDNRLENLRWGSPSLQRANQKRPESLVMPAVEAKKDGEEWKFYKTRKLFVEAIGFTYSDAKRTNIVTAIKKGTRFCGHRVRNFTPLNIGELRDVPAAAIGGVKCYKATEYGGWIQNPNKTFTQGSKDPRRDVYNIMIQRSNYKVHVLTTSAFWGLKPHKDSQSNHKCGAANGPADAKDLEWTTPSENIQHSHDSGLNTGSRAVVATLKDGSTQTFSSAAEAGRCFDKKGVKLNPGAIRTVCSGKNKMHGGMKWAHADGTKESRKRKFIDEE